MSNPFNSGVIVGHAASEPKIFPNRTGGATVKLSVFARNSFVNKNTGGVESEIVELTSYLPDANVPGVFAHIHTGDRVAVSYSLRTDRFVDKAGVEQFQLVARIDTVQLVDSKRESAARAAKRGAKTGAKAQTQSMQPAMAGAAAQQDNPSF
ncbi:hypothetical protein FRC0418_00585 [Corynebacterium diphtheriae]|nr:hypothetical protein FRC0263_00826 [Corynebacterium diphtheriae]CAB0895180.1 hypothetical protein FRC0418_00585 [Corynebacterium diphtheriae]CAB0942079.1 hypothetical protein FRC0448_00558 [Corynebacterium diphtheriae]